MGIKDKLVNLQTHFRDGGWRIKTIPWWREGELQKMYTSPLTSLMVVTCLVMFLGSIWAVVTGRMPIWFLLVGIAGLGIGIASNYLAAYLKTRRWIKLRAKVVDREIRRVQEMDADGPGRYFWVFRFVCEFNHRALKYRVTPLIPYAYQKEGKLRNKLAELVDANDECRLWVNPENPLETVLERKPKMLSY